ncbi:MAG: FecR domain-containing protein [Bacteroidales bacterium]|nr:FecR domain-containing protein [Bacteroidales bacterium]
MDKLPTYEETLIVRYLSGEAAAEDISLLKAWLEEDEKHRAIFREYRNSWALGEAARLEQSIDIEKEWEHFAKKRPIHQSAVKQLTGRSNWQRLSRIAALFLVLIAPSIIYFLFFMSPQQDMLHAETQLLQSTLPDGTEIALNKGSVLHYPEHFSRNERKVSLEGEAYFDVVRDEDKTFIIEAGKMQIRVLGTSFYVNTKASNNSMEVVLLSGSVQLSYKDKTMLLEPGDKAVVMKEANALVKQQNNDPNLLAWKTKVLRFNNTPLCEVVDVLEKVYEKDIRVLNPEMLKCRITATFEGESFESVMMVIQSTLNIEIRPNGKMIELSGAGCR